MLPPRKIKQRWGYRIGIVGRFRPWFGVPCTAGEIVLIETTFEGSTIRRAAAKALFLLHRRLPHYSWEVVPLGKDHRSNFVTVHADRLGDCIPAREKVSA